MNTFKFLGIIIFFVAFSFFILGGLNVDTNVKKNTPIEIQDAIEPEALEPIEIDGGMAAELATATISVPRSVQTPPKTAVKKEEVFSIATTTRLNLVVPESQTPVEATSSKIVETAPEPPKILLSPLDEESILKAVVKIQCPASGGLSKYVASGFVVRGNKVITAAHVVKDSADKTCDVIFSKERRPIHYLRGIIRDLPEVGRRHDEEGIDFAILDLPDVNSYPEAKAIFSDYPYIPYSVCENPVMLGDKLIHFGYPSNYADQNYLSKLDGGAVTSADINGIKETLSQDQTFSYKTPIFSFTNDESKLHPYMISRVASFYGDSGGLAFNATKQCILGPHRGGTIGKSSGENYSIFMAIGWDKIKKILE